MGGASRFRVVDEGREGVIKINQKLIKNQRELKQPHAGAMSAVHAA